MKLTTFKKGDIVFSQGDPGDCMYDIYWGEVGVYSDFGGPNQKKLAELRAEDYFGEMGLLDHAPRSATVVVLEDNTQLRRIAEEDFREYFQSNPVKVFSILQQLSQKLRKTTKDYLEVCRTAGDVAEAEKAGAQKSAALRSRLAYFASLPLEYDATWFTM